MMKHKKYRYAKDIILLGISGCFLLIGCIVLFYALTPLPDVEIENIATKQSIILEDRNGEFLFDFSKNEKRIYTPLGDISENIIDATIAIEDHLFFEHKGIRIGAFLRALVNNIRTMSFSQGGSTITQQVIKNVFLTTEKNIERKMKEFLLAKKLEERLGKEDILELYLNTIPYGGIIYGIGEASNSFFGKKPSEITIAEAAYLAAIPNAPTYFSPYGSHKSALEARKNLVLARMLEYELITRKEYAEARKEHVYFQEQAAFSIQAPHFVFFVKEHLEREHGATLKPLEGTRIRTTIDVKLQNDIEKIITEFGPTFEERYGGKNIASVVLAAKTGEILAMVGSRNFFNNEIDGRVNIITSYRQPGSTFKPISYAKAMEKGLRPETIVYDVPTQFNSSCDTDKFETTKTDGCYSPINYTGKFAGPISLREALAQSINIPAIKVLYIAGINEVVDLAEDMGINSIKDKNRFHGLSLGLGSAEITPLELAQAYSVFANDGIFIPYMWLPNQDRNGKRRVLSKDAARDITSILTDDSARAPLFGRWSPLHIINPRVAVKTGTTNNSVDLWVVGYSPDLVVLVWGGNSDGTPLEIGASGLAFSKTFKNIMLTASAKYGNKGAYFPTNTNASHGGPNILFGKINIDDQHSILHYIQKDDIAQEQENPENDAQYTHWEYAVQHWLQNNSEKEIQQNNNQQERARSFQIQSPEPGSAIPRGRTVTIITTQVLAENTQYEFYVNDRLIGSSHIPLFGFNPAVSSADENVIIRVVANSPIGTFVAEESYTIQN